MMGFIDVRDQRGHLLFRFDPKRDLVEIVARGKKDLIDLQQYRESAAGAEEPAGPDTVEVRSD